MLRHLAVVLALVLPATTGCTGEGGVTSARQLIECNVGATGAEDCHPTDAPSGDPGTCVDVEDEDGDDDADDDDDDADDTDDDAYTTGPDDDDEDSDGDGTCDDDDADDDDDGTPDDDDDDDDDDGIDDDDDCDNVEPPAPPPPDGMPV